MRHYRQTVSPQQTEEEEMKNKTTNNKFLAIKFEMQFTLDLH